MSLSLDPEIAEARARWPARWPKPNRRLWAMSPAAAPCGSRSSACSTGPSPLRLRQRSAHAVGRVPPRAAWPALLGDAAGDAIADRIRVLKSI